MANAVNRLEDFACGNLQDTSLKGCSEQHLEVPMPVI